VESYGRHTKIGRKFGLGVIGLGEGKGLIKGLYSHPELKVEGICDVNQELLNQVGKNYDIPGKFRTLEDMVKRPEIEIVVIYTPDQLHLEHIRTCFDSGKHVICTKPLVISRKEALEILKLIDRYPEVKLMVGQSSRFFGPMLKQRSAFESGKLGEVYFAETHYVHDMRWFYGNRAWAKEGGFDLLFAAASHPVDLIRWYMGDVQEVSVYADRSLIGEESHFQGNDIFVINLKFVNGRIGRVLGLYGLEQPHQNRPWIEVALYGSKGTFLAKYPQLESLVKYRNENERVESYFEDSYHYFQFEGVNHHAGEFVNYTEYFARSLVQGYTAMPDAIDGFKTVATLEAIRESTRSGKPAIVENYI